MLKDPTTQPNATNQTFNPTNFSSFLNLFQTMFSNNVSQASSLNDSASPFSSNASANAFDFSSLLGLLQNIGLGGTNISSNSGPNNLGILSNVLNLRNLGINHLKNLPNQVEKPNEYLNLVVDFVLAGTTNDTNKIKSTFDNLLDHFENDQDINETGREEILKMREIASNMNRFEEIVPLMFQLLFKLKQNKKLSDRVDQEKYAKFENLIEPIVDAFETNRPNSDQMKGYFSSLNSMASEYNKNNHAEHRIVKPYKRDQMKDGNALQHDIENYKDEYENVAKSVEFGQNNEKKSSNETRILDLMIQLFLFAKYLMHKKLIANDLAFK